MVLFCQIFKNLSPALQRGLQESWDGDCVISSILAAGCGGNVLFQGEVEIMGRDLALV